MHTRNHICESDNSQLFTRQLSTFLFFTEFSLSCENIARLHQFFLLCWWWYVTLLSFSKNQCWHQSFIKGYCQLIGCGLICGARIKTIPLTTFSVINILYFNLKQKKIIFTNNIDHIWFAEIILLEKYTVGLGDKELFGLPKIVPYAKCSL